MPELTKEQQTFIVQQLACYNTPQEVANMVNEEFGVEVPRNQVGNYDPTKPHYQYGKKWKDLFFATRQKFLDESAKIPILNKSFRAAVLQKAITNLTSNPKGANYKLILAVLEHAAKEEGNYFTNRREITGANGKDLLPADIAKAVYKELMTEAGFTPQEAMEFVKERYQVQEHQVVSEANN